MLLVEINKIEINGKNTLLKDAQFKIDSNKVYTILGKNGTGKTTLIKSLTGLLPKNVYSIEGRVIYNKVDILKAKTEQLQIIRKNKIKYVFQDSRNSFDPLKNFKYYFEMVSNTQNMLDNLLSFFLMPNKDTLYKLYAYEVSGGMAQRISLILALLAHPQIIILDEPTSGIDAAIGNLYIQKIREFCQQEKNAVLLVTHDISFALKISDYIAFMSTGKLSPFYSVQKFLEIKNEPEIENLIYSYKILSL